MRNQKFNYIAVGLFVLAMLGSAVGSAFFMTGNSQATDNYSIVMDNVADMKFGTQVRYEGYPIRQVEVIEPFTDGARMRFRIAVSVIEGWRLPSDSIARIGSSSLLSSKTIDISGGESEVIVAVGGEIRSGRTTDMFTAVAGVANELGALNRESMRPLIEDIGRLARRLGGKLEDDLTRLTASLNNIAGGVEDRSGDILARVQSMTHRLDESSAALRNILSDRNAFVIDGVIRNVGVTAENFAVMSGQLDATGAAIRGIVARLDDIVLGNKENVDKALTNAQYTLQTVARNIDSIMLNFDATSRNMGEFSRQIRQDPSLLLGSPPRRQISPASGTVRN